MSDIPVTVAILNHRRPHLLARVLTAVLQLDYPAFEVVVVGDQRSLSDYGLPDRLARAARYFGCDEANICRARNIAVAAAAGEVIAFCDDDAIPEPDWLTKLAAPFAMHEVGAVGGVVRAADGITPEWLGGVFDRTGAEHPLAGDGPLQIFAAGAQLARGRFLALRGVNSAFRRTAVHAVGGFDEAYRYYLDETDLALRLAEAGWSAALVRGTEVQHLPEQNVARGALRQPRDLYEIAASKAHFCRRHLPAGQVGPTLAAFRAARLRELDPHLRLGLLRLGDRNRLERRLDEGLADGLARAPDLPLAAPAPAPGFVPWQPAAGRLSLALVTGWGPLQIARLRGVARRLAEVGHAVSCFSYMSGAHAPAVTYSGGVWLHRGGTWRLDAVRSSARGFGRAGRASAEIARLASRRRFDAVLRPAGAHGGEAAALVPVEGLPTPLRVEPAGLAAADPAAIATELRRLLSPLPGVADAPAETPSFAAFAPEGPAP